MSITANATQSVNLFQILASDNSTPRFTVSSAGALTVSPSAGTALTVNQVASTTGLLINAAATNDALQIVGTSSNYSGFSTTGRLGVRTGVSSGIVVSYGAALSVNTNGDTLIGAVIRGGQSTQTADLTQWQNSSGTVLGGRNALAQVWSGSTAPVTVSTGGAISGTSSGTTATLTSASAHGLATGDLVTIAGMTPSGYNGTYIATVTGSTTFTVTTSGSNLGASTVSGTASVPAQASFTARSAGTVPLVARAWQSGSQIQFLQTWVDSSNAVQWGVTSSGGLGGSDAITGLRFGIDRNVQLCGNTLSVGSGKGVIGLTNANTVPTSNPTGGGVLYAEGGALKWRG
ncbi:MAG: hypothetical protein EBR82_86925, partial [Caulobacteraceae bacterium]|nr:hypothetical protein [Caulobacteraceae bacterium]